VPAGKTFSAAYLFGPTMPRNPHGNVIVYVTTLLGIDGMLGDRGDARYFLYPFAAAVFGLSGFVAILRAPERTAARRLMWFGLDIWPALTLLYCSICSPSGAFILRGVCAVHCGGCGRGDRESLDARRDARSKSKQRCLLCSLSEVRNMSKGTHA